MKNPNLLMTLSLAMATALPAQNTNQDAPRAKHEIEFRGATPLTLSVSYQQLTLAGGQALNDLMSKGARGDATRQFYNTSYQSQYLKGKIETKQAMTLRDKNLPAGSYGFAFRIDENLEWHLVISDDDNEVCTVPLKTSKNKRATSTRLVVEPVATGDDEANGYLEVRYGPLFAKVPFSAGTAKSGGAADAKAGKKEESGKR